MIISLLGLDKYKLIYLSWTKKHNKPLLTNTPAHQILSFKNLFYRISNHLFLSQSPPKMINANLVIQNKYHPKNPIPISMIEPLSLTPSQMSLLFIENMIIRNFLVDIIINITQAFLPTKLINRSLIQIHHCKKLLCNFRVFSSP